MRYFNALNIADTEAYKNVHARLVYLHLLCSMDYKTRECKVSSRQLALALDMTHKTVRYALEQLHNSGLLRAQHGAQHGAQASTYIISDIEQYKGTSEGTSEGTHNNNNNNNFPLTRMREEFLSKDRVCMLARYLECDELTSEGYILAFADVQELRQKSTWIDEIDAWQHLLSWCDKKHIRRRKTAPFARITEPMGDDPGEKEQKIDYPEGWTMEDWASLCRLVATPGHAPQLDALYAKGLKKLKKNERKK